MSRSYRKPYMTWCSVKSSAKQDKTIASRGVRRKQNAYLATVWNTDDWDSFLLPARYECPHNDVWGWSRDGKQFLSDPPEYDTHYFNWLFLFGEKDADEMFERRLQFYQDLCRK